MFNVKLGNVNLPFGLFHVERERDFGPFVRIVDNFLWINAENLCGFFVDLWIVFCRFAP